MLTIAIVEDEEKEREQLQTYLKQFIRENHLTAEIRTFSDGLGIVTDYEPVYDIIFFDIQMKEMDGFTAAKAIRQKDEKVILIFITNLAQYAIKGYSVGAMNFILKPVSYFAFSEECFSAIRQVEKRKKKILSCHTEEGMVRFDYDDLYYVEMLDRKIVLHTRQGEFHMRGALSDLEQQLADERFFRCHSAFLINLFYVQRQKGLTLWVNETEIPLARPRKKAFEEAYEQTLGGDF